MNYKLSEMKLFFQGGEADLYEVNDKMLLRVLRQSNDHDESVNELYHLLEKNGIKTPQIYEYGFIEGKQVELMERVQGQSMLEQISRNPMKIKESAIALAEIHKKMLDIEAPCLRTTIDERYHWFLKENLDLEQEVVHFLSQIFENLPKGTAICHSDFHPGNILIQNETPYIIDFAHAYSGNRVSDIAHTYLLMMYVPRLPGQGFIKYNTIKYFGRKLAKYYLRSMWEEFHFDWAEFSKWTVVMAAMRIKYGQPSEKNERIQYVSNCYQLYKQKVEDSNWYQRL